MIRSNLVSDFRGVVFKPIEFKVEGLKRSVSIPDMLSFDIEGVRVAQPQRRAVLYRQHVASRRQPPRAGTRRRSSICTASASIWTWSARATTGTSRHSPGRRRRAHEVGVGRLLRRERVVIVLALAGVTAIAWLYLFVARQGMDMSRAAMGDMPDMAMPFAAPWVFAMWWVMMLGMMLPSAAPMILTFAALQRRKRDRDEPYVPTAMFVAGYLIVWGAFCVAATAAQWSCSRALCCRQCLRWPVRWWVACCSSWPGSTSSRH